MTVSSAVPIGTASVHSGYVSAPTTQGRMFVNARTRVGGYTDYTFTELPCAKREAAAHQFVVDHGGSYQPKLRRDGSVIEHRVRILHL